MKIENPIKGTQASHIVREFFTNSVHFPVANILFEVIIIGPSKYFQEAGFYALLTGAFVQAYYLGIWKYKGLSRRFIGNIIGPSIYTVIEILHSNFDFFSYPQHIAYWGFSLLIGYLQEMAGKMSGKSADFFFLLEHITRTSIVLIMYWLFEIVTNTKYNVVMTFLNDKSHMFMLMVIPLLGLIIGFANISANHYLETLQKIASQLNKYSEWLLGKELLSLSLFDPEVLALKRKERTVAFIDIRSFTKWSDTRSPEEVVEMLNNYFEIAEERLKGTDVIKTKHTADEIMLVFPSPSSGVKVSVELSGKLNLFLKKYGLSAGTGIHHGELVEGLIGSKNIKIYDIIGDTVNTAKRLCDNALAGEILISQICYEKVKNSINVLQSKKIELKGKPSPVLVYPVCEIVLE